MSDSRISLSTTALAILSFVLAFFGHVQLLFLLIAYAVFLDKNQKLTRMSFQALYLRLAYEAVLLVIGWVFEFILWLFRLADIVNGYTAMSNTHMYINNTLRVLVFVAYLIGIIQIINKGDCKLPVLSDLADKTLGIFVKKTPMAAPVYQQAPPQPYQPPQQPQQAPYQPPQPIQHSQPPHNAAPVAPAPGQTAGKPASWTCSCGHENTGNFCMKCGNQRP